MSDSGFTLFETAIGRCGIAWGPNGLKGLQLPETDDRAAAARLRRRFPALAMADPPASVVAAIARIAAFLAGGRDDFLDLSLDFNATGAWDRAVYKEARKIPAGSTTTYGALAARTGDPGQARAIGQALGRNPWPIVVPCHRVLPASHKLGNYGGGPDRKRALLTLEGAGWVG